jgi:hypothetical protein
MSALESLGGLESAPSRLGGRCSFGDGFVFEQLFTAVADVCGLNDKVKATGYLLPVGGSEVDEA